MNFEVLIVIFATISASNASLHITIKNIGLAAEANEILEKKIAELIPFCETESLKAAVCRELCKEWKTSPSVTERSFIGGIQSCEPCPDSGYIFQVAIIEYGEHRATSKVLLAEKMENGELTGIGIAFVSIEMDEDKNQEHRETSSESSESETNVGTTEGPESSLHAETKLGPT